MAPSKLPEEHTLRPEDTRFWKRIDPRKLFPDQEEESKEEWVEACENAPGRSPAETNLRRTPQRRRTIIRARQEQKKGGASS
jgi:hypothetical protein